MNLQTRTEAFVKANRLALFDKHSVAHAIPCHPKNAAKALVSIHEQGLLCIDHWVRDKGPPQPVYRATRLGRDATKPDPLPGDVKRAARRNRPEVREAESLIKRHARKLPKLGFLGW